MPGLSLEDPAGLAAVFAALFLGGILKGATGAGLPVVSIPVISAVYDVRIAVAVMVIPNLITNLWQVWRHRRDQLAGGFAWIFAGCGAVGAAGGTFLLVALPVSVMQLAMVAIILSYIALRLLRPAVTISERAAWRLVGPIGLAGGVLQGATGISSPLSVTFLSAMRLPRLAFIHTISCFFAVMCAGQAVVQIHYGLLTGHLALLALAALVPMLLALPLGEALGRRFSAAAFDRAILGFLAILSVRLLWAAFS